MNNIFFARALRDFGDGFVAILLPVYLTALGLSAFDVGVIATAALLGSALLTLGAGFLAVRYDVRALLLAASVLMIASGLAYAAANDYAVLLVVAFVGTINPSGGSTSVFVPLEHTVLSGAARRPGAHGRSRATASSARSLEPPARLSRQPRTGWRRSASAQSAPSRSCSASMPSSA